MKSLKAFAATVALVALTSTAMAQTSSGTGTSSDNDSGTMAIPGTWSGTIGEAFYTDATGSALRPKEEALANFTKLTPEQQAQVQSDCKNMTAGAVDTGTTASTETGTAAQSGSNASDASMATATQVCDWLRGN